MKTIQVQSPYGLHQTWNQGNKKDFTEHYGLEMEVGRKFPNYPAHFRVTTTQDVTVDTEYPVYAVTDGSLSLQGVEYITCPMPKEKMLKGDWLRKTMHSLAKVNGLTKGIQPAKHGLHINVNTSHMSPAQEMLLQFVLNVTLTSPATDHIRQRKTPYRQSFLKSSVKNKRTLKGSYESFYNVFHWARPGRGSALACVRSGANSRLEVRGFHMNVDTVELRKKLNFIERVKAYVTQNPEKVAKLFLDTRKNMATSTILQERIVTRMDSVTRQVLKTATANQPEFVLSTESQTALRQYILGY